MYTNQTIDDKKKCNHHKLRFLVSSMFHFILRSFRPSSLLGENIIFFSSVFFKNKVKTNFL